MAGLFELKVPDRPGELDAMAKSLSDAGLNILWFYATSTSLGTLRVLLAVDEPAKAATVMAPWIESARANT